MNCGEVPPHLQVVLPVNNHSVAEHVPHDDQVGLLAVHAHTVHTQELRQQGAAMTLHDVLQRGETTVNWPGSAQCCLNVNIQTVKDSQIKGKRHTFGHFRNLECIKVRL